MKKILLFLGLTLVVLLVAVALLLPSDASKSASAPYTIENNVAQAAVSSVALETIQISADQARAEASVIEQQQSFITAENFYANLWASEKLIGTAKAIQVDDQGRLWATQVQTNDETNLPTKKLIYLKDSQSTGTADIAQIVSELFSAGNADLSDAFFYHNLLDELFIGANSQLWRLKDTNGDGIFESKTSIVQGLGINEQLGRRSISKITLGPDGMLYFSIGDAGTSVTDQYGTKWHYPNESVIARSEIDGSNFEVFACGLSDLRDFTFDEFGHLIGIDIKTTSTPDDARPQSSSTRIVHLIDGCDSGWRNQREQGNESNKKTESVASTKKDHANRQSLNQVANPLPPITLLPSSLSSLVYHPGIALTENLKRHFLYSEINENNQGEITAFKLQPKGASFVIGGQQNISQGIAAKNLTFGADGALYFSAQSRDDKTNNYSHIWKIDSATDAAPPRKQVEPLLASNFRVLPVQELIANLSHADVRVRQKAQLVLAEQRHVSALQQTALSSPNQFARIHAIWALGQLLRKNPAGNSTVIKLLEDSDPEIRAQAATVLGDAKMKAGVETLITLLNDENPRVQLHAIQALGRMRASEAIQPIISLLASNRGQEIYVRHAAAIALDRIGDEGRASE